jgi:hypothetical protein
MECKLECKAVGISSYRCQRMMSDMLGKLSYVLSTITSRVSDCLQSVVVVRSALFNALPEG